MTDMSHSPTTTTVGMLCGTTTPRDALTVSLEAVVTHAAHASLCIDARRVQVTAAVSLNALIHVWGIAIAALSTLTV